MPSDVYLNRHELALEKSQQVTHEEALLYGECLTDEALASDELLTEEDEQLILECLTMVADVAGIVDPTGASDVVGAGLSLASGDYVGAGLSVISVFPYVGDLAKLGKVGKWVEAVAKIVRRAGESPTFFKYIRKPLEQLYAALSALPEGMMGELDELRALIKKFFDEQGLKLGTDAVEWSWKSFYRFSKDETENFTYKIAEGRLVPPSIVQKHYNPAARSELSSGTKEHAGHIIGRRFGGPEVEENLFLQDPTMNVGEWKALENEWARLLEEGTGVEVEIRVVFPKNNPSIPAGRASGLVAKWKKILPSGIEEEYTNYFLNPIKSGAKGAQGAATSVGEDHTAEIIQLYE
ncbi:DNA/RNA non-specific endonuclease [Nitrososphaera sp.]|uniref:DNA/RNA non-specific endonuclease n=1 Tax=Nitrososphaera sp. TaxID=1971748 RepID=UPI00307CFB42